MRPGPLIFALVVCTAFPRTLPAGETSFGSVAAGSLAAGRAQAEKTAPQSAHRLQFGVMGEVARPGVYAASSVLTLTELIKRAGGITPSANKTVRIFRGGLLSEQVFIGAGAAPRLSPNDLCVVGTSRPASSRPPADAIPRPTDPSADSAVQIAFVNLIDRPVVVKMGGAEATVSRIVELLGQPAECAAEVRVFPPLGAGPHDADATEAADRPLASGTALVFTPSSIHADSLPALPAAISEAAPAPSVTPVARAAAKTGGPKRDGAKQVELISSDGKLPAIPTADSTTGTSTTGTSTSSSAPQVVAVTSANGTLSKEANPPLADRHAACDIAPLAKFDQPQQPARSISISEAALVSPAFASHPVAPDHESHAGGTIALMAAMSAMAGAAMLMTFASIAKRWMHSGKLTFRPSTTASAAPAPGAASASIPMPAIPNRLVGRPIRIDAGQPITRLSVDLAVTERGVHSRCAD